ncbi:hypothetical protein Rctr197k_165 [Virus Rctr197k]|nr:hypothetical protein Rctr197k_165 [Virus Rctr197k]
MRQTGPASHLRVILRDRGHVEYVRTQLLRETSAPYRPACRQRAVRELRVLARYARLCGYKVLSGRTVSPERRGSYVKPEAYAAIYGVELGQP